MNVNYLPFSIPLLLSEDGDHHLSFHEQANALGRHIAQVFSSQNCTRNFLKFKSKAKTFFTCGSTGGNEDYNRHFSSGESLRALGLVKLTSPRA